MHTKLKRQSKLTQIFGLVDLRPIQNTSDFVDSVSEIVYDNFHDGLGCSESSLKMNVLDATRCRFAFEIDLWIFEFGTNSDKITKCLTRFLAPPLRVCVASASHIFKAFQFLVYGTCVSPGINLLTAY